MKKEYADLYDILLGGTTNILSKEFKKETGGSELVTVNEKFATLTVASNDITVRALFDARLLKTNNLEICKDTAPKGKDILAYNLLTDGIESVAEMFYIGEDGERYNLEPIAIRLDNVAYNLKYEYYNIFDPSSDCVRSIYAVHNKYAKSIEVKFGKNINAMLIKTPPVVVIDSTEMLSNYLNEDNIKELFNYAEMFHARLYMKQFDLVVYNTIPESNEVKVVETDSAVGKIELDTYKNEQKLTLTLTSKSNHLEIFKEEIILPGNLFKLEEYELSHNRAMIHVIKTDMTNQRAIDLIDTEGITTKFVVVIGFFSMEFYHVLNGKLHLKSKRR